MAAREPTIFEQATDSDTYPSRWDAWLRARLNDGYTDEEAVASLPRIERWDLANLRWARIRTEALRREINRPAPRTTQPGPKPSTTPTAVDAARRRLEQDGQPSGERPIAADLGVSRGAVRHALGKDRR